MEEDIGQLRPGEVSERNALVVRMARRYVVYLLAANAATLVLSLGALGRVAAGSEAEEMFRSSAMITGIGVAVLVVIVALFRLSKVFEESAARLDVGRGEADRTAPAALRKMRVAVRLVQLGYRLVLFTAVALVIAVITAAKAFFAI
jgi:hypothetical protein